MRQSKTRTVEDLAHCLLWDLCFGCGTWGSVLRVVEALRVAGDRRGAVRVARGVRHAWRSHHKDERRMEALNAWMEAHP